jgi:hypothetical protein
MRRNPGQRFLIEHARPYAVRCRPAGIQFKLATHRDLTTGAAEMAQHCAESCIATATPPGLAERAEPPRFERRAVAAAI